MNDTMLLLVGIGAFGLMFVAIVLTIFEFRELPRRQKPEYREGAAQAQPAPPPSQEARD